MEINKITQLGSFKSYKEVLDFVPRSVWECNSRTKEIKGLFVDDVEKHTCTRTNEGYATKIQQKFSVFNPTLAINILKIWSNDNDIVLDPFAGRDRALICNWMNRHYVGYEISPKTFTQLGNKMDEWKNRNNNFNIQIHNADGTTLGGVTDESFDLIFSCPPYWDKEKYESCEGQISDIKKEEDWKTKIKDCANACFSKLKKDKFAVFVIADIRKNGKMIPLHSHWIDAFLQAGFNLKDIVVNKTNPMNCSGINGFLRNRIMWKSHEYVLVFKK
jgi:DNA modification methylase